MNIFTFDALMLCSAVFFEPDWRKQLLSVYALMKQKLHLKLSDDERRASPVLSNKKQCNDMSTTAAQATKKQFPYRSLLHISPTSNIVDRCGIKMRPHRGLMDPSTLEMLVLLRFNRDLWDEKDVDTIMTRTQSAHVSEPPTPTSHSQASVSMPLSTSSASR